MSEPFKAGDDFVVEDHGRWIKFPTDDEAWEYYQSNRN